MDESSVKTLDSVVESASFALFESVGVPLERVPAVTRSRDDIGASIWFTSSVLRGAVVLISTRALVRQALPEEMREGAPDEQIADWMGELTNQLLGRIKNKLLSFGVTLEMSTPTVIFGIDLANKDTRARLRRQFAFRSGEEPLSVFLDAVSAPGLELTLLEEPPPAGIAEGDLALF